MGVRRNIEGMVDKMVLLQARIIVGALILGQVFFAGVIFFLHQQEGGSGFDVEFSELVRQIVAAVTILFFPIALFLRKKTWGTGLTRSTAQSKAAFLKGYILFHAILEGGSLLNLVFWLATGLMNPNLYASIILIILQALNFPKADRLPQVNR